MIHSRKEKTDENVSILGQSSPSTFAEREGFAPPSPQMRLGELDRHFRQKLLVCVRSIFPDLSAIDHLCHSYSSNPNTKFILEALHHFLFDIERMDISFIEPIGWKADRHLDDIILRSKYYRTLTFVESMIRSENCPSGFRESVIRCFNTYGGPYHIADIDDNFYILPSVSMEDQSSQRYNLRVLEASGQSPAVSHFKASSDHIRARKFRESIKESISAVESVARRAVGHDKFQSLGQALEELEKTGVLPHKNLYESFRHIYKYTNDEEGIRHALINADESKVTLDEAVLMFSMSAAIAAYIAQKTIQ